jgi:hypothetical protein
MGGLRTFNLKPWVDEYKIKTFIETGVGAKGNGITHAQKYDFDKILSVDIDKVYYDNAVDKFKGDNRVDIYYNNSKDFLDEVLPIDGNILFWLDAHFPDSYVKGHDEFAVNIKDEQTGDSEPSKDYVNNVPKNIRMPLEDELETIINNQDISNCVFLVDDYRCYEPESGNFGLGKHINRHVLGNSTDSTFFDKLLGATHNLEVDRRDSGYLIATPKKKGSG